MQYLTPTKDQLGKVAPFEIWKEAILQAKRSDHKRHRTGCVLYDRAGDILAKGCSHTHNGGLKVRSIHAEMDALSKLHYDFRCSAVVVTLTKGNHFAAVSKPCHDCAKALTEYINVVTFAERANDASWQVLSLTPEELLLGDLKPTKYAVLMI